MGEGVGFVLIAFGLIITTFFEIYVHSTQRLTFLFESMEQIDLFEGLFHIPLDLIFLDSDCNSY